MSGFEPGDYSVVVKNRGNPPDPWRWEIYRAGRSSAIKQSSVYFHTMAMASRAGGGLAVTAGQQRGDEQH